MWVMSNYGVTAASVAASIPTSVDVHPFTEHAGKGCQVCGKNRNGKAHAAWSREFNDRLTAAHAAGRAV